MGLKQYKLVILDRDGVINHDSVGYIKDPAEWHAIAGSLEAIAKLNKAGIKVAVATNQSGIGREFYSEATLKQIHAKMITELTEVGGHIDIINYCPHHPDTNCDCRKPKAKMLLDILEQLNISAADAVMIGDKTKDVDAAHAAGMDGILVGTAEHPTLAVVIDKLLGEK